MRGQQQVYDYLSKLGIQFDYYEHPEAPTIEIASQFYRGERCCARIFSLETIKETAIIW